MQTKRLLLFLIGCIGARIAITLLAKYGSRIVLTLLACFALIVSIGFMTIYLTGSRKTGPETFGDKIWWNDIRPVHACLYFLFAILAFQQKKYAWVILAIDVVIGLLAFIIFHTKYEKSSDYLAPIQ